MERIYEWKVGARVPRGLKAEIVGGVVEEIQERKDGRITPQAVVEASRKPTAPLHSAFEWNDAEAAERYREGQAGYLLRHLMVSVEVEDHDPILVRAVVSICERDQEGDHHVYRDTIEALQDDKWRSQIVAKAVDRLHEARRILSSYEAVVATFGPANLRLAEIITDLETEKEEIGNAEINGSGIYQTATV